MAPILENGHGGLHPWMVDAAPCGLLALGLEGQIDYINQTLLDWLERPRHQIQGKLGLQDVLSRAGAIYLQTHMMPMLRLNGGFQEISLPLRSASGQERHTLVAGRQIDETGRAVLIFSAADARARSEQELSHIRDTAQTRLIWLGQIERMANIGAWSVDVLTGETTWSDQVFAIHDLPVGSPPSLEAALSFYPAGEARQMVEAAVRNAAETGEGFQFDTILRTAERDRHVRSRGGVEWEKGKIRRLVGIFEDITEEAEATRKLWRAAHIDELSGLANRTWFRQKLAEQIAEATQQHRSFNLMLLDLDHFKEVNDAYGHPTGDAVIRITAERISAFLGQDAFVGRFGGDEFAVIQWDGGQTTELEARIEQLMTSLGNTIRVAETEMQVGVSIGIARFPQDAASLDGLVRSADMALLHAKRTRKGGAAFFDWHIRAAADRRRDAIERVRHAVAAGQVVAHYQPRVHLATGEIRGYEALARILEPGGEASGPAVWGSALDDPDCARLVDQQVLRSIIADWPKLARNLQGGTGAIFGSIGLNTSEYSLKHGDFVSDLLKNLRLNDIPPSAIEIEVLETVLVGESNPRLGEQLAQLRREGISVALDDFGTGFASLMHLRDLPIDRIKLDQSFVLGLDAEQRNRAIVRATVDLAQALGMRVVAEGIESHSAKDFLRSIGCDEGQGYLFGRPAPL